MQAPPGKPQERWVMSAEKFLMPDPKPPLDEEEIREAVWELLFSRAPPALVRVVGKQVYHRYSDPPSDAAPMHPHQAL